VSRIEEVDMSSILVTYASKHGGTQGIADRIARQLTNAGHAVELRPVKEIATVDGYDAVVIGSAAYMGSWLKDATEFVRRNVASLAMTQVWLFSSGPLGTNPRDAQGNDLLTASAPKEFAEFKETIKPRDMKVFFGALDPNKLNFAEKLIRSTPAGRTLLPEGDFRDWNAIEEWAGAVAAELAAVGAGSRR
jgi:menaquinone-dependent protoporphyrinogen oxidase